MGGYLCKMTEHMYISHMCNICNFYYNLKQLYIKMYYLSDDKWIIVIMYGLGNRKTKISK